MKKLLKRTAADDFRVMPYNLRWLTVLGIGTSNDRRRYRLAIALALTVVIIILPKPIRISEQHPFESIVRSLAELLFGLLGYLTIIIVASKSEPFRQVIQKLEQALASFRDRDDQCSRLIVKVNGGIYRFSVAYARLNLVYMLLFNLVPPAVNYPYYLHHLLTTTNGTTGNRTVEFMLPLEQDFYGLDIRHNILHYSAFWLISWMACTFTVVILWAKGALFILIRYNTLLYQLVNCMLRELGATAVDGAAESSRLLLAWKQRQLVQTIELHRTAIECTKLLDSILRLVLLIQSVGCLLMWCLMLYYISRNANLNVVNLMVLTLSIVFEMWCFSYLGHQLTEANASIANTAYSSCSWYQEPRVLQKTYQRIMMQATSRQATITAGRFHNVNIVTFAQLVKTSYTYYMIMKEIF
ncbi:uncharacterized protein LOC118467477 isoform X2 [Anopheles albimanus]|uniref:Uncharacterized protein n=1 Tax=Anopheles albimanus TaxID=7167 RepID=A0A182FCA0_ANOAL|nr:uncharacterized protein LOC118467477 isoform X2 [Anopheles albimanus]